jgi:hypothetical protein
MKRCKSIHLCVRGVCVKWKKIVIFVLPLKPKVALPACGKEADRFVEGQRGLVEYPTSGKVLKEVGEEGLRLIK